MATLVFTNAKFEVNAVNLSTRVESVTLNYASESIDDTTMGSSTRKHKGGLFDWSFDVTFHQDYAAGNVDATLWPIVGVTACLEFRACNSSGDAANPIYSGIGVLIPYPIGGGVGELHKVTARWESFSSMNRTSNS